MTTPTGASVWRLYNTDGVPGSGPHAPEKSEVIAWADSLEGEVADAVSDAAGALAAAAAVAPFATGQIPAATPSAAVVTIDISTDIITWTAHGRAANEPVRFSTTGALPTGITANVDYFIVGSSITANGFKIATSVANAIAGTAINMSGTQSGTHTAAANLHAASGNIHSYGRVDLLAGSAISMMSGVPNNILSVSLPPGRYLVWGNMVYSAQGSTAYNETHNSLSLVSGAQDAPSPASAHADHVLYITGQTAIKPTANKYVAISVTTTLYLVASVTVTGGSAMLAYGTIEWLRL